jgi:hypothetical protein
MSDDPHDYLLQIRNAVAKYSPTFIVGRMHRARHAKLRAGLLLPYGYCMSPKRLRDPRGLPPICQKRLSWPSCLPLIVGRAPPSCSLPCT